MGWLIQLDLIDRPGEGLVVTYLAEGGMAGSEIDESNTHDRCNTAALTDSADDLLLVGHGECAGGA